MTTQVSETSTTLEAVRTLAPAIVARSEEIERGRRVPPDLVEELTVAGCLRALVPRSHAAPSSTCPPRCG
jgi:indole-3-acetate monooxygenase